MGYHTLFVLYCVVVITATHVIIDDVMSDVSQLEAQLTTLVHQEDRHRVELILLGERAVILEVGICPGDPTAYRCKMSGSGVLDTCLSGYLVCDGVPDCPHGDDEILCDDLMMYMQPGTVYDAYALYDRGCSTVSYWKKLIITGMDLSRDPITNKTTASIRQEMFSDDTTVVVWYEFVWQAKSRMGYNGYFNTQTYWLTWFDAADTPTVHSKAYWTLTDQMCAHYVWKRQ